jgi:type 2 lantibiotic biosynthesis protein LanM
MEVEHRPYMAQLIAAERTDLTAGDIPLFACGIDSRDIQTSSGQIIPEFLAETSLESVKRRFLELNQRDLEQQLWFIRASIVAGSLGDPHSAGKVSEVKAAQSAVNQVTLLGQACAVGERLEELALREGGKANWVRLSMTGDREWALTPAGLDLHSGTSGIVLFLAYLGALTGNNSYTDLARAGLGSLRQQIRKARKAPTPQRLGAFSGIGSPIYVLAHLAELWQSPDLAAEACGLVELLPPIIQNDQTFDMLSGSAGCISALLALYQVYPCDSVSAAALECGKHLLNSAQRTGGGMGWVYPVISAVPLTGFSHGNAGIALSLLRLAALSRNDVFRQLALEAVEYERSVFSPLHGNWPDFREIAGGSGPTRSYSTTWCHGAPGIGMARVAALRYVQSSTMEEEIKVALQTTLREGFGLNHSLCHGDLGNLELLLLAAEERDNADARARCRHLSAGVIESIAEKGWCTGLPLGVESPGLMTGLAGIGYQLLRLAYPEQVPSVLLLDAPPVRERRVSPVSTGQRDGAAAPGADVVGASLISS